MMPEQDVQMPRVWSDLRDEIVGCDRLVPVLDGSERPYIYLDNAASTPAFKRVLDAVREFLPWYSGVHRGTGFKSLLATEVFDAAHDAVGRFVGADLNTNTVIFTKNTTECVNKLSNRFEFEEGHLVLTTLLEHHSNDLPWRRNASVLYVGITPDGHPDLMAMRRLLEQHRGRVKLVAVTLTPPGRPDADESCHPDEQSEEGSLTDREALPRRQGSLVGPPGLRGMT